MKLLNKDKQRITNPNIIIVRDCKSLTTDIGAITNFVFQGVNNTGNQDISRIGTDILKRQNRYDERTKKVKPLIEE